MRVYSITHIPTTASGFSSADKMQSLSLLPDSAAIPFWTLWTALQLNYNSKQTLSSLSSL